MATDKVVPLSYQSRSVTDHIAIIVDDNPTVFLAICIYFGPLS